MEECELVERARGGDADAFGELVGKYQSVAFHTAYLITENVDLAEDAVQEAFVRSYCAMERFRSGAPFRPWLLRIVVNEARKGNRTARRREGLARRTAEDRLSQRSSIPPPETELLDSERRTELFEAIKQLKEEDRLVIAYRYFFDMREDEMAQALGCARGTVKSRLSRALGRLRDAFCAGAANAGSRRREDTRHG